MAIPLDFLPAPGLVHIPGLNREKVEEERKNMWGQIFKKYEEYDQRNELTKEVSLEEIDSPETVREIILESSKYNLIKPNAILQRYFDEHKDEIDEIATVAGPPASDEEILTDDSDDEELCPSSMDGSNATSEGDINSNEMQSPVTPPTSDSSDDNNEGEDKDIDEKWENNETLNGENDDEAFLYNMPLPEKNNLLEQVDQSLSTSAREPKYKKAKLHSDDLHKLVPVDLDETINVASKDDIQAQAINEKGKSECLVCTKCLNITFYEALASKPDFLCDECLAGEHLECEVEDCRDCKQIGEMVVSRRQAEVFGRVEKLTGRDVSQM